jgi:hypothetical protein
MGVNGARGWHLLSNPFNAPLTPSNITLVSGNSVQTTYYIFDSTVSGEWRSYNTSTGVAVPSGWNGNIPAFSAFWVQVTSATNTLSASVPSGLNLALGMNAIAATDDVLPEEVEEPAVSSNYWRLESESETCVREA